MIPYVDPEEIEFRVGMRVRARVLIVENDLAPDPTVEPCSPGWPHCWPGDYATVVYIGDNGLPDVVFDRTGTRTICCPSELEIVPPASEVAVPFPQVDLSRVLTLVEAVGDESRDAAALVRSLDISDRTLRNYINAGVFLGLLDGGRGRFAATDHGRHFARAGAPTRWCMVRGALLERPVFREALAHWAMTGVHAPPALVEGWLGRFTPLKASTRRRRARTVLAWCDWLHGEPGVPWGDA